MLADGLLKEADDEGIERGLVVLGPACQLLVEGWRHADLEVNNGFGHSEILRGAAAEGKRPNQRDETRAR